MRVSSYSSRSSGRESLFTRPAHLDDLVARIEAGETFEDTSESRHESRYDFGRPRSRSSANDSADDADERTSRCSKHHLEAQLEEADRDKEVMRMQIEQHRRQQKSRETELELHKKHGAEFRALLEVAEGDLAASNEKNLELSHKLQLAQEASFRNADMAQQLLTHLNSCRAELKAKSLLNEHLRKLLNEVQQRESDRSTGGEANASNGKDESLLSPRPEDSASSLHSISRPVLHVLTHDAAVQVNLLASVTMPRDHTRQRSIVDISQRHAQELNLANARSAHNELAMERRPSADAMAGDAPGPSGSTSLAGSSHSIGGSITLNWHERIANVLLGNRRDSLTVGKSGNSQVASKAGLPSSSHSGCVEPAAALLSTPSETQSSQQIHVSQASHAETS